MKKVALLIVILAGFMLPAQHKTLVYVDVNNQLNKGDIIKRLNAVLTQAQTAPLVYLSNENDPVLLRSIGDTTAFYSRLLRISPNLPRTEWDVTQLTRHSNQYFASAYDSLDLHFFLNAGQFLRSEKHLINLVEFYLLLNDFLKEGALAEKVKVHLYLNPVNLTPSEKAEISNKVTNLKQYHVEFL